jgi:hypothetical protein
MPKRALTAARDIACHARAALPSGITDGALMGRYRAGRAFVGDVIMATRYAARGPARRPGSTGVRHQPARRLYPPGTVSGDELC